MIDKKMLFEVFIKRLLLAFGEPKREDTEAYLELIYDCLKDLPADALEPAAIRIIRAHGFSSWPTIAEMRAAIEHEASKAAASLNAAAPGTSQADLSEEIADRLIQSDVGVQSASEGWLLALWDYCRETMSLPGEEQIPNIRSRGRRNAERRMVYRGEQHHCSDQIKNSGFVKAGSFICHRRVMAAISARETRLRKLVQQWRPDIVA